VGARTAQINGLYEVANHQSDDIRADFKHFCSNVLWLWCGNGSFNLDNRVVPHSSRTATRVLLLNVPDESNDTHIHLCHGIAVHWSEIWNSDPL